MVLNMNAHVVKSNEEFSYICIKVIMFRTQNNFFQFFRNAFHMRQVNSIIINC